MRPLMARVMTPVLGFLALIGAAGISFADGNTNGYIQFSTPPSSVHQEAGVVRVLVSRTISTLGAVSVAYTTVDGTAVAGTDYTAASGTIHWNSGTGNTQSFNVRINVSPAFYGTKTFSVVLSAVSGGAELVSPSTVTVTIVGDEPPPCAGQNANSYVTTNAYDFVQFGNYTVQANDYAGNAGQLLWANSAECWGVTNTQTTEIYGTGAAPGVQRGWTQNCTAFNALGGASWAATSGMGIQVANLTKARVHWSFTAPGAYPLARWNALIDNYFWTQMPTTCSGDQSEWNAKIVDLMVDQAIDDQVLNGQSYYASVAAQSNASVVVIYPLNPWDLPVAYLVYVDNPSQIFNAPGGHTIEMFLLPTAVWTPGLALWGSEDQVTDLAAIIQFWEQPNPKDVNGNPILYSDGTPITSPLILPTYYWGEIYAGFEQDYGSPFQTNGFCVALQNEPDCQ